MSSLRVSRPEMIGILCGFAAAATLTGAIMMFNVWPALTTPPLVLENAGVADAAPARAPVQSLALNVPAISAPESASAPASQTQALPPATPISFPAPSSADVVTTAAPPTPVTIVPAAAAATAPAPQAKPADTAQKTADVQAPAAHDKSDKTAKNEKPAKDDKKAGDKSTDVAQAGDPAHGAPVTPATANAAAPQPDVATQIAWRQRQTISPPNAEASPSASSTPPQSAPAATQILTTPTPTPAKEPTKETVPPIVVASVAFPSGSATIAAPPPAPSEAASTTTAPVAPSTPPPAEGTTASTGGSTTIVINFTASSRNAAASARALAASLRAKGFSDIATNALDKPVDDNEVKFFHAHDKAEASKLKALANGVKDSKGRHRGYDMKDASATDSPPAPGHIEIWLKGS